MNNEDNYNEQYREFKINAIHSWIVFGLLIDIGLVLKKSLILKFTLNQQGSHRTRLCAAGRKMIVLKIFSGLCAVYFFITLIRSHYCPR